VKHSLLNFPHTGSFVAGLLIGLSIVVPVVTTMGTNPADWLMYLVFAAPVIFALGLVFQVIITSAARQEHAI
jgi:formate/nitrite transporter FocA (FNT family)